MLITSALAQHQPDITLLHQQAFNSEAATIQQLLADFQQDNSAQPLMSLVALEGNQVVGNVVFSRARMTGHEAVTAMTLAPLGVLPRYQKQGVGSQLIKAGLEQLTAQGVALVFVFGDPAYYQRFGFQAAPRWELTAPYPIPAPYAEAWQVLALQPNVLGTIKGQVQCCAALSRVELWQVEE
ncbi:GNAT family N-acetyltransferase [Thiofilum flexile]|uniref:GNAT family N-acetyltransferase n=1 Tax=Thiofilum flexile TaxID=125627 RepID=UPI0013A536FC|nr:N-acetyltransferase [Thiofilum flexile]